MATLVTELNELRRALSSRVPTAVDSPAGKALQRGMEATVKAYFNSLWRKFPMGEIAAFYPNIMAEIGNMDLSQRDIDQIAQRSGRFLSGAHEVTRGRFIENAAKWFVLAYIGGEDAIPEIIEAAIRAEDFERDVPEYVLFTAEAEAARLVTQMELTTQRELARMIARGIEQKRGYKGLGTDIRRGFENMTVRRSRLIAATEINRSYSTAHYNKAVRVGAAAKEWHTVGGNRKPDECDDNEAQGEIRIGDDFFSGHSTPPAHPDCHCFLTYS